MAEKRLVRSILCAATIALGLGLRRFGYDLGLPFPVVKYGGSALWGTMMFFIVGVALPSRSRTQTTVIALTLAILVELSRLYHTPELDAFRQTAAGALLLGRVFSVWNMVAYAAGVILGFVCDRAINRR